MEENDCEETCDCWTPEYCRRPHTHRTYKRLDKEGVCYVEDDTPTCDCSDDEDCPEPHTHHVFTRKDTPFDD